LTDEFAVRYLVLDGVDFGIDVE